MENKRPDFKSTLKSLDTEETIDIYFYRPIGYQIALLSARVGITPNPITVVSIILGVLAGYLFSYDVVWINLVGIFLLVFANSLDSADGQLARMTDNKTRLGRFLDGFAGNLWFVSIYIAICIRFMQDGGSWMIFILALVTGIFHSFQAAMADYYRNAFLYFVEGKDKSEVDTTEKLKQRYIAASWKSGFFNKLFLRLYLNYTNQQEMLSGNLQKLYKVVRSRYNHNLPGWLRTEFRKYNKPLMKYCNFLTTNARFITLFFFLLIDEAVYYFVFELTVMNGVLIYLVRRQENISAMLKEEILGERTVA